VGYVQKMSNWPMIVNACNTKNYLIFLLSLPFALFVFTLNPKHILSPCYVCFEHDMGIMGM